MQQPGQVWSPNQNHEKEELACLPAQPSSLHTIPLSSSESQTDKYLWYKVRPGRVPARQLPAQTLSPHTISLLSYANLIVFTDLEWFD